MRFVPANDIEALEAAFSENTAGMLLELIQGEGGILPVSSAYALKARELADRHNALLVFDEIQCGVGRPGTYFAYQRLQPEVLPDIMVAAKPLACGLPLGVIVANEKAAATIGPGMHGSTFGGSALACRVALEFFDILEELLPAIQRVGGYFHVMLNDLARKHSFVKEVRGFGLMIGVETGDPRQADGAGRHGRRPADELHTRYGAALPAALHLDRARRGCRGKDPGEDFREAERSAGMKLTWACWAALAIPLACQAQSGWIALFDGKSMAGWEDPRQKVPPGDAWSIDDGCLRANRKPRITEDLFTKELFGISSWTSSGGWLPAPTAA